MRLASTALDQLHSSRSVAVSIDQRPNAKRQGRPPRLPLEPDTGFKLATDLVLRRLLDGLAISRIASWTNLCLFRKF